ncbi:hypothetical protein, partial [Nocardia cyriacigeorgica]|uniref:hypothetical protein n=1 Tax=Nocardia cyriacigeorgica TaxID=135487 RepID=UPI001E3B7138
DLRRGAAWHAMAAAILRIFQLGGLAVHPPDEGAGGGIGGGGSRGQESDRGRGSGKDCKAEDGSASARTRAIASTLSARRGEIGP